MFVQVCVLSCALKQLRTLVCCRLQEKTGPVELKGAYGESLVGYKLFKSEKPYNFKHGGVIPRVELAYETWGELNSNHSNAILLHTGLSASSHARSHKVCTLLSKVNPLLPLLPSFDLPLGE